MSEANKRARIEYLQGIYRDKADEAQRCRTALEHIAVYCEAEPQTSAQALMAKLAREAIQGVPETKATDPANESKRPPDGAPSLAGGHTERLLPCPFCGKEPVTERTGFSGRALYIYCINDNGCPRPKAIGETAAKAAENWNLRHGPSIPSPGASMTNIKIETYSPVCNAMKEELGGHRTAPEMIERKAGSMGLDGDVMRENHWRKLEGRNPLPAPDPVRKDLADDERILRQFIADGANGNRARLALNRLITRAAPQPVGNPLGSGVREALYRELHISSDFDHRSWADIERALASLPEGEGWQAIETDWAVRRASFDDEAPLDNRFEVLRPDATWRGVIAVSVDDARKTAMEEWQDERQCKAEQTIIPQGLVSVEYTASKGLSRVDCWVTRDEGERIRLGGVFILSPAPTSGGGA